MYLELIEPDLQYSILNDRAQESNVFAVWECNPSDLIIPNIIYELVVMLFEPICDTLQSVIVAVPQCHSNDSPGFYQTYKPYDLNKRSEHLC